MPNLRLVILLISAFLLTASITHLQAQQFVPEAIVCPVPPTGYGAAMSYFVHYPQPLAGKVTTWRTRLASTRTLICQTRTP